MENTGNNAKKPEKYFVVDFKRSTLAEMILSTNPRVYDTSKSRIAEEIKRIFGIGKTLRDFPSDILKRLEREPTGRLEDGGHVYAMKRVSDADRNSGEAYRVYERFLNVTRPVTEALNLEEARRYLELLESLKGQEVERKDLIFFEKLALRGFYLLTKWPPVNGNLNIVLGGNYEGEDVSLDVARMNVVRRS